MSTVVTRRVSGDITWGVGTQSVQGVSLSEVTRLTFLRVLHILQTLGQVAVHISWIMAHEPPMITGYCRCCTFLHLWNNVMGSVFKIFMIFKETIKWVFTFCLSSLPCWRVTEKGSQTIEVRQGLKFKLVTLLLCTNLQGYVTKIPCLLIFQQDRRWQLLKTSEWEGFGSKTHFSSVFMLKKPAFWWLVCLHTAVVIGLMVSWYLDKGGENTPLNI